MTLDEFRGEMDAYRQDVAKQGRELKDSQYALERLEALYRKFDAEERAMADQVIAEWILSNNEGARFDGRALARRLNIKSAIPALEELANRLASSNAVGAAAQLEVVEGIL